MNKLLWILVGLLLTAWVLGFLVFKVVSLLIHVIWLLALILILYNWFNGFQEK